MTTPGLSAAEAAIVERFEAGEAAPESWRGDDGLREAIRDELSGWPLGGGYYQYTVGTDEAREMVDAVLALPEVAALRAKAAAADRVRELADAHAFLGANLHDVPRAETYAQVAAEIRHALDGESA